MWSAIDARRNELRTQLWPLPACGILAGLLLPRVDANIDGRLPPALTEYLFEGGSSAARQLLAAVRPR